MRFIYFILAAVLWLPACKPKDNAAANKTTADTTVKSQSKNDKIRNGIQVQTKGVTVEQAFLTYEDGRLVDEHNKTNVNEKLKLNLVIDGWQADNNIVDLEAAEKVTDSRGNVLLNEGTLFSKSGVTNISTEDARHIKLHVVINQVNELSDYYLVQFRVWNQRVDQSVEGSYKFYL